MLESFVADQSIIDTLKMESSKLSPSNEVAVKKDAILIQSTLVDMFDTYITPTAIDENKELEERIIIVNSDAFNALSAEWPTDKSELKDEISTIRAFTTDEGQFLIMNNPNDMWKLLPREEFDKIVSRFGSFEKARNAVAYAGYFEYLVHEIVHRYQDPSLPIAFLECGACYYQTVISSTLEEDRIESELIEKRSNHYRNLVALFGNDVHHLFFGTLHNDDLKKNILMYLYPKIVTELFPTGF